MTQHAIIAPSSLDRIVACPGSVYLSSLMPAQPERPEATEGDAAHWVAMRIALGEVVKKGETAPNGVLVDSEMIEGGETYADALDYLPGIAEKTVTITAIHHSQCFGTPDFFQYAPNTHTLRVTDYKYGFRYVEVYENWQLMAYASGVMEFLGLSDEGLKHYRNIGEGMIIKGDFKKSIDWADVIIFDSNIYQLPEEAEYCRKRNKAVLGSSQLSGRLENDRAFAVECANSVGLTVPDFEEFSGNGAWKAAGYFVKPKS